MAHRDEMEDDEPRQAFFSERLSAFLIDGLLFYGLFLACLRLVYPDTPVLVNYAGRPWLLVWTALFIVYHAEAAAAGRPTLGKWLLGLRVEGLDGKPLPFERALLRAVGYLPSSILNLGFVWSLFHPEGLTWHDMLAKSRVVAVRPRPLPMVMAGGVASLAFLAATFLWQAFGAPHFYRVRTIANAQITLGTLGTLQEIHRSRHGGYTEKVERLVDLTPDPEAYYQALASALAPEAGIRIDVDKSGEKFTLTAFARDRLRTQVRVEGPHKG